MNYPFDNIIVSTKEYTQSCGAAKPACDRIRYCPEWLGILAVIIFCEIH